MRYVKLLLWVLIGVLLVSFAMANNELVSFNLFSSFFEDMFFANLIFAIPLFVVVYTALLFGVIFGVIFEYFREHKYRAKLRQNKKEIKSLRVQINNLSSKNTNGDTEILNMIDKV